MGGRQDGHLHRGEAQSGRRAGAAEHRLNTVSDFLTHGQSTIWLFVWVFSRLLGLLLTCSPLAPEALKPRFRATMAFWVALALCLGMDSPTATQAAQGTGHLYPWWALMLEVALGAGMGLVVRLGSAALSLAGELVEMVVGFGFAQMVDPMNHEQAGPLRLLAQSMGAMTFLALGGQQLVIENLARSFVVAPPGQLVWQSRHATALVTQLAAVMVVALRMAAPLLAAAMSTLLALAFLTKVAPQLNIWSVGFLVTTSVSLAGLLWYLPSWLEQTAYLWRQRIDAMLPTMLG